MRSCASLPLLCLECTCKFGFFSRINQSTTELSSVPDAYQVQLATDSVDTTKASFGVLPLTFSVLDGANRILSSLDFIRAYLHQCSVGRLLKMGVSHRNVPTLSATSQDPFRRNRRPSQVCFSPQQLLLIVSRSTDIWHSSQVRQPWVPNGLCT